MFFLTDFLIKLNREVWTDTERIGGTVSCGFDYSVRAPRPLSTKVRFRNQKSESESEICFFFSFPSGG